MKNNRFYGLSAVYFCLIFLLVGCDWQPVSSWLNNSKENILVKESGEKNNARILTRTINADLTIELDNISQLEQTSVLRDINEGLVIYDIYGNIQSGMAERWQTEDQKTWIFYLRENSKWSNGEIFSAHDIVRSWQALALSTNPYKQYFSYINLNNAKLVIEKQIPVEQLGIQALDDHRLLIKLDKPTPYLPKMLAHIALLPRHPQANVHNGAYYVISQNSSEIKLAQNPHYYGKDNIYFQQVIYHKLDKKPAISIDITENAAIENETSHYFANLCTYFYDFNFREPLLQQSAVRKALVSMAYTADFSIRDKRLLINRSLIPKHFQLKQYREFKPTLVEQQLQQVGISEKNPLQLRLTYDNSPEHSLIAERLIRAWSQSDLLRIQPDPVSYQQLLEKRQKGDFQLIRSGWCADYNDPSAFLNMLHSNHPDNKIGLANQQIDKLLEQSLVANLPVQKRNEIYRQLLSMEQQEQLTLPFFQYSTRVNIASSIKGFDLNNPTQVLYSKDLYRQ